MGGSGCHGVSRRRYRVATADTLPAGGSQGANGAGWNVRRGGIRSRAWTGDGLAGPGQAIASGPAERCAKCGRCGRDVRQLYEHHASIPPASCFMSLHHVVKSIVLIENHASASLFTICFRHAHLSRRHEPQPCYRALIQWYML